MSKQQNMEIMKVKDAVARARQNGFDISEYTLRRAIHSGQLPCRIVGRTYLISWTNLVNWVTCKENCDNPIVIQGGIVNPRN